MSFSPPLVAFRRDPKVTELLLSIQESPRVAKVTELLISMAGRVTSVNGDLVYLSVPLIVGAGGLRVVAGLAVLFVCLFDDVTVLRAVSQQGKKSKVLFRMRCG